MRFPVDAETPAVSVSEEIQLAKLRLKCLKLAVKWRGYQDAEYVAGLIMEWALHGRRLFSAKSTAYDAAFNAPPPGGYKEAGGGR